jgi:dipeptidyl aminopeptidase/acylaminoacyl peptidase
LQCELKRLWDPHWSPDGRSILVTGIAKENKQKKSLQGLYRINIQNGDTTALVEYDASHLQGGNWRRISSDWSSDGKAIFFKVHNRILMREIESQQEIEIYHDPNLLIIPEYWRSMAISPDGQKLAFGLRDAEKEIDRLLVALVASLKSCSDFQRQKRSGKSLGLLMGMICFIR